MDFATTTDTIVRRAFTDAVEPLYPALVRRLTLVVGDPDEAQDLAQTAYLRAFRAWPTFRGSDVRAWLYTIGLRLAFNELRRRRRWGFLSPHEADATWAITVDPDLWAALATLGRRQRAALLLQVLDGYTQAEIATFLDVPAGTVASWLARSKQALRRVLQEE